MITIFAGAFVCLVFMALGGGLMALYYQRVIEFIEKLHDQEIVNERLTAYQSGRESTRRKKAA